MIDDVDVTTNVTEPQEELQTIVSQNDVIITQNEQQIDLSLHTIVVLFLIIAVLGILVAQGFVKLFKR